MELDRNSSHYQRIRRMNDEEFKRPEFTDFSKIMNENSESINNLKEGISTMSENDLLRDPDEN